MKWFIYTIFVGFLEENTKGDADIFLDCFHSPNKVYPLGKFDQAHTELEPMYGKCMKAMIDSEALNDILIQVD